MTKIGPFWDNYDGLYPMQPYQPEFVVLSIRKYVNGTVKVSEADILSCLENEIGRKVIDNNIQQLLNNC